MPLGPWAAFVRQKCPAGGLGLICIPVVFFGCASPSDGRACHSPSAVVGVRRRRLQSLELQVVARIVSLCVGIVPVQLLTGVPPHAQFWRPVSPLAFRTMRRLSCLGSRQRWARAVAFRSLKKSPQVSRLAFLAELTWFSLSFAVVVRRIGWVSMRRCEGAHHKPPHHGSPSRFRAGAQHLSDSGEVP